MLDRFFFILVFLAAGFSAVSISAQVTPPAKSGDDEPIRIDTQLIDVPMVVTDRTGKPIMDLKKNNFVIYEDGKLQEVTEFSATSAPFEVALFLDTSGSARSDLTLIQRAAQHFIDSLRPGDRVSIIAFRPIVQDNQRTAAVDVVVPLMGDRAALKDALARVTTSNGTPYYDGLIKIVEEVFRDPPAEQYRRRRALVALTDGVDSASATDFDEAKELLEKAGIVSYFIRVDTRPFFEENLLGDCESAIRFSQAQMRRYYRHFGRGSRVEQVSNFCKLGDFERLAISKRLYEQADAEMTSLAKASGGKVFAIDDLNGARLAFRSVAAEIGTNYSLGYYSSNEKRDGTYRRIKVELKGLPPGSQVRAREGYTAPSQ